MRATVTVCLAEEPVDERSGEDINQVLSCNVSECALGMRFFSPCIDSLIFHIRIPR